MSNTNRTADAVRPLYDRFIRPFLPTKYANLNGVAVRNRRLLDSRDDMPYYKDHLIEPIRELVSGGDRVTVIGGGSGVASVIAARRAKPGGHVTTYEAAAEYVDETRDTIRRNRVEDVSTVVHGIVGDGIDVWGSFEDAAEVHPEDLEPGDVLVIDAEGAELGILEACPLEDMFEHIIIETHPAFGAPPSAVRDRLDGYRVRESTDFDGAPGVTLVATRGGR